MTVVLAGRADESASLRVLIVAESASASFGGEAALPLHYFRVLRKRGVAVWLLTHARNRDELSVLFPDDPSVRFVADTWLNRMMWAVGKRLPPRLSHFTAGFVSRLSTQLALRRVARSLVAAERIDVVHQPMPVSPREPSTLHGLGAPVVIGPMNGGMSYPPAFVPPMAFAGALMMRIGRWCAQPLNLLMPGKRRAALLLVANQRTRDALPRGVSSNVVELVENGVDLQVWRSQGSAEVTPIDRSVQFLYLGRLVEWKGIDFLLAAYARARVRMPMRLVIAGDGEERVRLETLATRQGLHDDSSTSGGVRFTGWLTPAAATEAVARCDCLILPSLLECGGAVVLEAMATGKPVIATDWGGPRDYLDSRCGILVPPAGKEAFVAGLCDAMVRLASFPEERKTMGARGRQKVIDEYDWDVKADRIMTLYRSAITFANPATAVRQPVP